MKTTTLNKIDQFLKAVYGKEELTNWKGPKPPEEIIATLLRTLTPKEAKVIEMRVLGEGVPTLRELQRSFGLTAERIRQLQAEALRKLRHPSRARRLRSCNGIWSEEEKQRLLDQFRKKERTDVMVLTPEVASTPVESLDISFRLCHCLKNKGIQTVGELIKLSTQDAMRIKSLGRITLRELRECLADRGLYLRGEEPDHLPDAEEIHEISLDVAS